MQCKKDGKHFNLYYIFLEDQKGQPPPQELIRKLREWLQHYLQKDV